MNNIIKAGKKMILAHLNHFKEHGKNNYLKEALAIFKEKHIKVSFQEKPRQHIQPTICGCPGAKMQYFTNEKKKKTMMIKRPDHHSSSNDQFN